MPEDFTIAEIIDTIKEKKGLSRDDIAEKLGYNANYISNAIRNGGNAKFYNTLKLTFPDIFNYLDERKASNILNDDGIAYGKRKITFEDLAISIFKQQAILQVLLAGRVEDLVTATGSPYNKVLKQLESAVTQNLREIESQFQFVPSKH